MFLISSGKLSYVNIDFKTLFGISMLSSWVGYLFFGAIQKFLK